MEATLQFVLVLFVGIMVLTTVFLLVFQPLWGILDVATSEEHSSGTKVAVILLTFLLLGPIMTFFYACFGTHSRGLKKSTITCFLFLVGSFLATLTLSAAYPAAKEKWADVLAENGFGESQTGEVQPADPVESGVTDSEQPPTYEVADESLTFAPFKAVHYVLMDAQKWSVSIADFSAKGPVEDSALPVTVPSIYPLNQIAIDASGPVIYGITTHKVGKIVPSTGHFVELEIDPALPEMSWPSAIAFDSRNKKLVVTARSGVYTYDPATGEWLQPSSFDDLNFLSLIYDESDHSFHGIVAQPAQKEIDRIVKLSDTGAVVSTLELSPPLPTAGIPTERVQLIKVEEGFLILIAAHYARTDSGASELVERQTYIVHPETGQIKRVAGRD